MIFVQRRRVEPAGPQVTPPAVPCIYGSRIALVRKPDALRQGVASGGHGEQMHMVAHQAIGPNLNTKAPGTLAQHLQVKAAVIICKKDLRAQIAPMGDMMRAAWKNYAGAAWHRVEIVVRELAESSVIGTPVRVPETHYAITASMEKCKIFIFKQSKCIKEIAMYRFNVGIIHQNKGIVITQ